MNPDHPEAARRDERPEAEPPAVVGLRCEWARAPLGIDAPRPRLSWHLAGTRRGLAQSAYEIRVTSDGTTLWSTGRVESSQSVAIPYAGPALRARQRCEWRVRVWDDAGQRSSWSEPATWETGLREGAWSARWISPTTDDARARHRPSPMLRHEFSLADAVETARLFVTCHGLYEVELNGLPVSRDLLRPGWTSYHRRLQYQTYDVTELLRPGANAIGVTLTSGWWRGEVTGGRRRNVYGSRLALLLQLEAKDRTGDLTTIGSGPEWRSTTVGPIRDADPFCGEEFDATRDLSGWSTPGFDDDAWSGVEVLPLGTEHVVAQHGPSVRKIRELTPRRMVTHRDRLVVDMGQNMVGWIRFRADGPPGSVVRLRYGELLDAGGRVTTDHLRMPFARPIQQARLTLGAQSCEYEPRFTTNGFRFVEIDGPRAMDPASLRGVVVSSELPEIGSFACSDDRLNRLHECIVWSRRGNFVEIPTDCPTRERSGWTGDAQVVAPVTLFTADAVALFERWLRDLAADQGADGNVPDIVPWVRSMRPMGDGTGSTGWGDAATIIPMLLYGHTGDTSILERQLPSMLAWVGYLERRALRTPRWFPVFSSRRTARGHRRRIVDSGFHWGDHYPIGTDSVLGIGARFLRPPALIATAFFARSVALTGEAATILGDANAEHLDALHREIVAAFVDEFVADDGRLRPHSQSSYVLALAFGLLPPERRPDAVAHLLETVRAAGDHATTGFLATPYLLPVLADAGHPDVAYDLLLQSDPPSWLAMVAEGATTIWESLRAIRPGGKPRFRSLNHLALGAVGEFLHRYVAGLDVTRTGLGEIRVDPFVGGGLTWARAEHRSVHGPCSSAWTASDSRVSLDVTVPPNVVARVTLPGASDGQALESGVPVASARGIRSASPHERGLTVTAGAGTYSFSWPVEPSAPFTRPG